LHYSVNFSLLENMKVVFQIAEVKIKERKKVIIYLNMVGFKEKVQNLEYV